MCIVDDMPAFTFTQRGIGMVSTLLRCTLLVISGVLPLYATTFYCDPARGNNANDGSYAAPWKTLKEMIDSGKIETRQPVTYPYVWGQPLQAKNAGAPVKAGDTIILFTGYHGDVTVSKAFNTDYITVMAGTGQTPQFKRLLLQAVSKWRVKGLVVSPELAASTDKLTCIEVQSHNYSGPAREVSVESCYVYTSLNTASWDTVTWKARSCNGISVSGRQVTVRGNRCKNVNFGIQISADSCLCEYNEVDVFDGDGLRGVANDLIFQYNLVKNSIVANGANHDDGFQSWSVGPTGTVGTGTVYRVKLIGNVFLNNTDPALPLHGNMQGIGCFDGYFEDWVIENNIVVVDHWHGISLYGARNCRIVNNTVLDMYPNAVGPAWIMITDHKDGTPSSGCVIRNNLTTDLSVGTGVVSDHNIKFTSAQFSTYFADYAHFDFRLKSGCAAIDSGSATLAPSTDIAGTARPQNGRVDIGAYECEAAPALKTPSPGARSIDDAEVAYFTLQGRRIGGAQRPRSANLPCAPARKLPKGVFIRRALSSGPGNVNKPFVAF